MHSTAVPTFDGVLIAGLRALGVPSIALFLVITAFAVKSWVDGIRQVNRGISATRKSIGSAANTARQMPSVQLAGAIILTMLVPLVQLLLLEFCYIIGNFLSALLGDILGHRSHVTEFTESFYRPLQPLAILSNGLHLDVISGAYLLFGIGCLARSYWLALHRMPTDSAGKVLAFPATILGFLGARIFIPIGVLTIIGVLLNAGDHAPIPGLFTGLLGFCIIVVPAAAVFYAASIGAVRASTLVVEAWSPPPEPALDAFGAPLIEYRYTLPPEPPARRSLRERVGDYLFWSND